MCLIVVVTVGLLASACRGMSDLPPAPGAVPPAPDTTPAPDGYPLSATVTITSDGVSPQEVVIGIGGRVTFVNQDARPHDTLSDPHDLHTECVEINVVGFLSPGQRRQTRIFESAKDCGFHDHLQPAAFFGRILVK